MPASTHDARARLPGMMKPSVTRASALLAECLPPPPTRFRLLVAAAGPRAAISQSSTRATHARE